MSTLSRLADSEGGEGFPGPTARNGHNVTHGHLVLPRRDYSEGSRGGHLSSRRHAQHGRTLSTGRNCIHHTGVVNRHVKDPAGTSIARGWGRAHGLAPITLRIACMPTVRNQRLIATSQARKPAAPAAPQPGSRPEEAFLVKCRIRGVPGR